MPDPQPVPINAKFDDDFVTQLVVVLDTDTMHEVAAKVAHHVVGKRVPARDADMVVSYQGRDLPSDMTVAEAGIAPLQNVYVDWVEKRSYAVKNAVGPVLRMSEDIDAIIAAIEEDNPGTAIEVIDRGAYVRIQAEHRMKVTRASIERHIGRTFEMREFEPMMSAFAGRIETTSDAILWSYKREEELV